MADTIPIRSPDLTPKNSRRRKLRPLAVGAKQLAKLLSCGIRTIRTWDAAGKLPKPARISGRCLWSVAEIERWLAAGGPPRDEWEAIKKASRR